MWIDSRLSSLKRALFLGGVVFLTGCSGGTEVSVNRQDPETGRWYTKAQVLQGKDVFDQHCIACHKAGARGAPHWKKPLEDGSYPPPPLNGTAHAWHHPLPVLLKTIDEGGIPMGGKMPPFKDVLNQDQKIAVIAYFQSFWPEPIYRTWRQGHRSQGR